MIANCVNIMQWFSDCLLRFLWKEIKSVHCVRVCKLEIIVRHYKVIIQKLKGEGIWEDVGGVVSTFLFSSKQEWSILDIQALIYDDLNSPKHLLCFFTLSSLPRKLEMTSPREPRTGRVSRSPSSWPSRTGRPPSAWSPVPPLSSSRHWRKPQETERRSKIVSIKKGKPGFISCKERGKAMCLGQVENCLGIYSPGCTVAVFQISKSHPGHKKRKSNVKKIPGHFFTPKWQEKIQLWQKTGVINVLNI